MTGKRLKAILILLIITSINFLTTGSVLAKEPQFRLDIDSLSLKKGVSTNLTLSLINAQNVKSVEIEGLDNFDVLTSSQSTSTHIVNGDITRQTDVTYIIMPKNTGEFTLLGSVEYNGKTYKTNELKVSVKEGDNNAAGEQQDVFVKTILSSDDVYYGQKIALTYELYSRYNIENFGFLDVVNLDGFIMNDMPDGDLKASYTYIGDNRYIKYEAKKMYLVPIKAGTFSIPSFNFQVNIGTGGFFGSQKPVYLKTEQKQLMVKPLPKDIQPTEFSGLVGDIKLESKYSKHEVEYGTSLTLSVSLLGNCNLDVLKNIINKDIPGFSVYETEKVMEESIENGQYLSRKDFEIILVPEKNGKLTIEPMYISYFNTESETYEKVEIPGIEIMVTGEMPESIAQSQNAAPPIEAVTIDQISYKPQREGYLTLQINKGHLYIVLWGLAIVMILAAAVIVYFTIQKKQDKKLENIYKQLKKEKNENEIYNLLNSMIKHKFNFSLKASPKDKIENRLASSSIAIMVLEVMDYMEKRRMNADKDIEYLKRKIKEIFQKLKHSDKGYFTKSR